MKECDYIYDGAGNVAVVKFSDPYNDESKFTEIKAKILKDCYDEYDLHCFRSNPKKLKKGTPVIINRMMKNLYGCYYRIEHNNETYDIDIENVEFI